MDDAVARTFLGAHCVVVSRREAPGESAVESPSSLLVQHVLFFLLAYFRLLNILIRLQNLERRTHRRVWILVIHLRDVTQDQRGGFLVASKNPKLLPALQEGCALIRN